MEKKYVCPCCGKESGEPFVCRDCPAVAIEKK